jgi:uncharacterized protein (DUF3084 family)
MLLTDSQLQQDLQALRQQVEALQRLMPRSRVSLEASRSAPFLGQTVTITGTVTDAEGNPQRDAPVVVATTWGRLRSRDRLLAEQGTSLAVRTGADGRFRVELLPLTSEDLLAVQQEALEPFLGRLDANAATPRQTEAGLREMAQLYQWDSNFAYRQALDIYFRDFGQGLLESVNTQDYLERWDFLEATVVAYAQAPGQTAVQSSAVLLVPFKQWLGPWLEVFLALAEAQSPLNSTLEVVTRGGNASVLMDGVYQRMADYVGSQPGLVGAYMGRKVAERTVQSFLLGGLGELDVEARAALVPSLQAATDTLATAGGLTTLVQTRRELKREVGTQIETSGLAVGELTTRVGAIATQVSGLQSTVGTVDGRVGAIATQVTGLQSTVGTVDSRVGTLTSQLRDVQSTVSTVRGRVDTLQTRFDQFDPRLGGLTADLGGLRDQVGGWQSRFTQVDDQVGTLSAGVVGLTDRVEGLQGQVGQVDRNVSGLGAQVDGLQGRFTQVDDQVGSLVSGLTGLTNQFGTLQGGFDRLDTSTSSRLTQVATRLGTLEGRLTLDNNRFSTVVGRLDVLTTAQSLQGSTVSTLEQSVAEVGGSVGQFSDRLDSHDKTLGTLQDLTQQVDGRLGALQTSNQALEGRVTQLNRDVVGLNQDTRALNQRLTQVDTSVTGLQGNGGTLNTRGHALDGRVSTVQVGLTTLNTQVGTLDNRFTALNGQVGTLDNRFTALNGQVGTLDNRFTTLNGQVGGLERNLGTLTRVSSDRIAGLENSISRVGNNVLSLRTDLNR